MKRCSTLPLRTLAVFCAALSPLSSPLMADQLPKGTYRVACTVQNYSGVEVEVTVVGKTGNTIIPAIANNSNKTFTFTSDLTHLEFKPKGSETKEPIRLVPTLTGDVYTDASPLRISFNSVSVPVYTATQKKQF